MWSMPSPSPVKRRVRTHCCHWKGRMTGWPRVFATWHTLGFRSICMRCFEMFKETFPRPRILTHGFATYYSLICIMVVKIILLCHTILITYAMCHFLQALNESYVIVKVKYSSARLSWKHSRHRHHFIQTCLKFSQTYLVSLDLENVHVKFSWFELE